MRRDVAFTLATRLVMLVGGFGASVVTARALGPENRGNYVFATTLAATIVQFGNLGLPSSNTYLVASGKAELRALLANSFWVALGVGIGAGLIAAGILTETDLFPQTPTRYIWFAVALVPPSMFFLFGANLLIGIGKIRAFNLYEAGSAFVALLFLGGAALAAAGVVGFLIASAAAWWVIGLALLLTLRRQAGGGLRFSPSAFRTGVRYATKAYVVALLGFLVLRSNYFLLARLAGTTQIGYFSVAAQLSDVLALVPTATAIVIFPRLVQDRAQSWPATLRAARAVAVGLAVLCVLAGLFASPVVKLAFGSKFGPSVGIIRWMLPGVLALGVTAVISQHIAALGMPKQIIAIWAFGLGLVLVLGRILIPIYGDTGAGVSYSCVYGVILVLIFTYAWKLRRDEQPLLVRTVLSDGP